MERVTDGRVATPRRRKRLQIREQPAGRSVDRENDASIALLNTWIAEAPTDPQEVRAAEDDVNEFMANVNAERKRVGARLIYPETQ